MGGVGFEEEWEYTKLPNEDRTIVLVGRTGNGKSSTGNSILGKRTFKSLSSSAGVTSTCEQQRRVLENGQILNVIDTPGLFDFSDDVEHIGKEIVKCIDMAKDGIHAVLVVLSTRARFSREEDDAIEGLRKFFGSKISDYMIVVFTGGDDLAAQDETLDDYLGRDCPEPLQKTLKLCENRRVLFDNRTIDASKKSEQLEQLLSLVDVVVDKNGGKPYTNEIFVEMKKTAFKQDISEFTEQFNKTCEVQIDKITKMVELRLRDTIYMLELQLAKEQAARVKLEAAAQKAYRKSKAEMRKLRKNLEKAEKETEELRKEKNQPQQQQQKMGGSGIGCGCEFTSPPNEVRTVVLVGKTGNGKSSTGNTIIGTEAFEAELSSCGVTDTCELKTTVLENNQTLNVIDTPGLFDSSADVKHIGNEIVKCIKMAKDGIHAVLVVLSVRTRFSPEEASVIESLREFFGNKISDYMIVIFTGGDELRKKTLADYLRVCPEQLKETLKMCGNRCVLFDNRTEDAIKKSKQLNELLSLVDDVVYNNGGKPFTDELFAQMKKNDLLAAEVTTSMGCSKRDISEFKEHLKIITELVESRLREMTHRLEKQLAEEQVARMKAESAANEEFGGS